MAIIKLTIKAALKAVFKKFLNTERGKKMMNWLKEKIKAILESKITKAAAYFAFLAASAAVIVLSVIKGSIFIAALAIIGLSFAHFTLFLEKSK